MGEASDLSAEFKPLVRERPRALRGLVRRLVPDAGEMVHRCWRRISCKCEAGKHFCAIGLRGDQVKLYFPEGVELSNPQGLLSGGTREMRQVRISELSVLDRTDWPHSSGMRQGMPVASRLE